MRRFIVGLMVGIVTGWLVAWWRLEQGGWSRPAELEQESMRITLPDRSWDDEAKDMPATEPTVVKPVLERSEGIDKSI